MMIYLLDDETDLLFLPLIRDVVRSVFGRIRHMLLSTRHLTDV